MWLLPVLAGGTAAVSVASALGLARGFDVHATGFFAVTSGIGTTLTVVLVLAAGWHLRRRRLYS